MAHFDAFMIIPTNSYLLRLQSDNLANNDETIAYYRRFNCLATSLKSIAHPNSLKLLLIQLVVNLLVGG